MAGTVSVHECLFCPQTFGSAADKDDHVLEHFSRETCTECNQSMIRIGGKVFVEHNAETCIKSTCYTLKRECDEGGSVLQESAIHEEDSEDLTHQSLSHMKGETFNNDDEMVTHIKEEYVDDDELEPVAQHDQDDIYLDSSQAVYIKCEQMDELDQPTNADHIFQEDGTSEGDRPKCELCGNSFFDLYTLRRHKVAKHNAHAYRCTLCKAIFRTEKGIQGHRTKCAKDERNEKRPKKLTEFECELCHRIFNKKFNLFVHRKRVHHLNTISCKTCTSVFDNKVELEMHTCSMSKLTAFQCDICQKYFTRNSLRLHKLIHTAPEQLRCAECGTEFTQTCSLRMHMKMKHDSSIEKFQCKFCHRTFFAQDRLDKHLHVCKSKLEVERKKMEGEQSYTKDRIPCEICGVWLLRRCIRKHIAIVHSKTKTVVNPPTKKRRSESTATYECEYCQRIFNKKFNLLMHLKKIHNKSKEAHEVQALSTQ